VTQNDFKCHLNLGNVRATDPEESNLIDRLLCDLVRFIHNSLLASFSEPPYTLLNNTNRRCRQKYRIETD